MKSENEREKKRKNEEEREEGTAEMRRAEMET